LTGSMVAPVTLRIRNTGLNPITSAIVGYQMTGGSTVLEAWSGNITTGQTADHTFATSLTTPAAGSFGVTELYPGHERWYLCHRFFGHGEFSDGNGRG
jgi:hypothetical protein